VYSIQDGKTALHIALVHGIVDNDMDVVRLLVNYGANVNIKDEVTFPYLWSEPDTNKVTLPYLWSEPDTVLSQSHDCLEGL
jgi:ankyrin repeat protein